MTLDSNEINEEILDQNEALKRFHNIYSKVVDDEIPKTFIQSVQNKAKGCAFGLLGTGMLGASAACIFYSPPLGVLGLYLAVDLVAETFSQSNRCFNPSAYCYQDAVAEFKKQDPEYSAIREEIQDIKNNQGMFQNIANMFGFGKNIKEINGLRSKLNDMSKKYDDLFSDYQGEDIAKDFDKHSDRLEKKFTINQTVTNKENNKISNIDISSVGLEKNDIRLEKCESTEMKSTQNILANQKEEIQR